MNREALAYLCIDIHDFNEELLLEYASIGSDALIIAKDRLNFLDRFKDFKDHLNRAGYKKYKVFKEYVTNILEILENDGLDVNKIHQQYKKKMEKLETEVNLLFDKMNAKEHTLDIFDDEVKIDEYKHNIDIEDLGIELQPIAGRNPKVLLPPIINQPKLSKWKQWRMDRNKINKKPRFSKSGYAEL